MNSIPQNQQTYESHVYVMVLSKSVTSPLILKTLNLEEFHQQQMAQIDMIRKYPKERTIMTNHLNNKRGRGKEQLPGHLKR